MPCRSLGSTLEAQQGAEADATLGTKGEIARTQVEVEDFKARTKAAARPSNIHGAAGPCCAWHNGKAARASKEYQAHVLGDPRTGARRRRGTGNPSRGASRCAPSSPLRREGAFVRRAGGSDWSAWHVRISEERRRFGGKTVRARSDMSPPRGPRVWPSSTTMATTMAEPSRVRSPDSERTRRFQGPMWLHGPGQPPRAIGGVTSD